MEGLRVDEGVLFKGAQTWWTPILQAAGPMTVTLGATEENRKAERTLTKQ